MGTINKTNLEKHKSTQGYVLPRLQARQVPPLRGFILLMFLLLISPPAESNEVAIATIAWESSGESFEGQVMVASVIKTRMAQRKQTAEKVCKAKHQFSCWDPKTGKATQKRQLKQSELLTAKKAWERAKVGKYNHYCRYDVKPYWVKSAKASVRMGEHVFYEI